MLRFWRRRKKEEVSNYRINIEYAQDGYQVSVYDLTVEGSIATRKLAEVISEAAHEYEAYIRCYTPQGYCGTFYWGETVDEIEEELVG